MKKINVALVGLGFGGGFAEIYKEHPMIGEVGIYDISKELMDTVAKSFDISKTYDSFEEILSDKSVDAVHLVTPIPLHEEQTIAVLDSGKHCACTVPMAISIDGIAKITEAVRRSGKKYMMMETTLYTYQFFYVQEMLKKGELGKIQFLRGSHYQNMKNWPEYWMGLPPMFYGTHAIAPMVALSGSRISKVNCLGSGSMDEALIKNYGNPFPIESALFSFENGLKGEATRSLFETARAYQEGMFVYGSKASFEWGFCDEDKPYVTTDLPTEPGRRGARHEIKEIDVPNYYEYLPAEIQKFTVGGNFDPLNPQDSLKKGFGGGHHGSHPHMVHEFITSICEDRRPWTDEVLAANITAAGICAHDSAMNDGTAITIPVF